MHVRLPAHRKANITARAIPWITVQAAGQIANAAATIGDFPYEAGFGHCSSTRVRWADGETDKRPMLGHAIEDAAALSRLLPANNSSATRCPSQLQPQPGTPQNHWLGFIEFRLSSA